METMQSPDFIIDANTSKQIAKDAKQGDSSAQFIFGGCYYFGKGVAKNRVKAVKWYRKAAEQGNAKAQSRLGGYYEQSESIKIKEAQRN